MARLIAANVATRLVAASVATPRGDHAGAENAPENIRQSYMPRTAKWFGAKLELPQSPPEVEASTTASIHLDLALARKLPMPKPLEFSAEGDRIPGGAYAYHGDPPGDTMYRWYYEDCDDGESIGDVIVQAGQAVSLWFQDCAGNKILRTAIGQFYSMDEHGKTTWFAETAKEKAFLQQMDEAEAPFRQARGVPCAMMADSIEAIADEHLNYPDKSRDEIVARSLEAALPGLPALHAAGQDISIEQLNR